MSPSVLEATPRPAQEVRLGGSYCVLLGCCLLACGVDGQAAVLQFLLEICNALLCGPKALYDPL